MDDDLDRRRTLPRLTVPRLVLTVAAWAAVPVLIFVGVAGCSDDGDSGSDGSSASDQADSSPSRDAGNGPRPDGQSPSVAPARFDDLPEPCSTVDKDTIKDVVPAADPKDGKEIESNDTSLSAACLWAGVNDKYQFRSLTVSLRRFESDPAVGSGDERAQAYTTQLAEEITGDDAHENVETKQLDEPGDDGATSISYTEEKQSEEGDKHEYREQRVIARVGNVVVSVDYSGAGFEGADPPKAKTIRDNAQTAAAVAVAALESFEQEQDGPSDGQSDDKGGGQEGGRKDDEDGASDDS